MENFSRNAVATNTSNRTLTKSSDVRWLVVPVSRCVPWFAVFITESLAVITLNIITIVVFVKQRQRQRQSTCLIIHLAMVDLMIGAVIGPVRVYEIGNFCDMREHDMRDVTWLPGVKNVLMEIVHLVSISNLSFISLERVHATFRPFKHRFIKKWVYGLVIAVIWSVPVTLIPIREFTVYDIHSYLRLEVIYFYYHFTLLLVISVSYCSIYTKVRCSRHPQRHGAAGLRERKLTSTLFLVTFGSFFMLLPVVAHLGVVGFNSELVLRLSFQLKFRIFMTMNIFLLANSLVNPIIYALRMPALRAGLLQLLFRRAPNRLNPVDIPIQGL